MTGFKVFFAAVASLVVMVILAILVHVSFGSGAFERAVTFSGVYAVCKPKGYEVVCFLDADSKQGGLSCVPLNIAGGVCK